MWADLAENFTAILHDSGASGSPHGWSQNTNAAHAPEGAASARYDAGTRDGSFAALVRRSGAFAWKRRNAALAAWFKTDSGTPHCAGFLLRFQPGDPAHGPEAATASDLTGGAGYVLWIDRYGLPCVAKGALSEPSLAPLWPRNWGAAGPILGAVEGGYFYRVKIYDAPGGVAFDVGQAASASASAADDGAWTRVFSFVDGSASRIAAPGLFGAFLYTSSGVNRPLYLDAYRDAPLEE